MPAFVWVDFTGDHLIGRDFRALGREAGRITGIPGGLATGTIREYLRDSIKPGRNPIRIDRLIP